MRALATVLLLANLLFFAWSRGWLDDVTGVRARGDREPERLARQVRPEAVQMLTPAAAARAAAAPSSSAASTAAPASAASASPPASAAAPAGGAASAGPPASAGAAASAASSAARVAAVAAVVCLEAGPFDAATFAGAQTAVRQLLPTVRWADLPTSAGGSWIVYMGAYANREAQARKEDELRRIRVGFEEVTAPPALQWGLSLGRYDNRGAAEAALARFTQRGIRTARIVETVAPVPGHRLRVEPLDETQAAALLALPPTGAGRRFVPCSAG